MSIKLECRTIADFNFWRNRAIKLSEENTNLLHRLQEMEGRIQQVQFDLEEEKVLQSLEKERS